MSIFGALSIARSGLISTSNALSVVGDNIANVNTVGFKGSRATFADLFKTEMGSAGAVGSGTTLAAVTPLQTQGGIEATGRSTDVAIDGNGFFLVQSGESTLYTRAGNFQVDNDGNLVTFQNLPVLGYALDAAGEPTGSPVAVQLAAAALSPSASTEIDMKSNLDAEATVKTFPAAPTTFAEAADGANAQADFEVFDSLGGRHVLTAFFTKTGTNAWEVNVGVKNEDVGATPPEGLTLLTTAPIALTFNAAGGSLDTVTPDPATLAVTFTGAAAQNLTMNFGTPNPGGATAGAGLDGVTQNAGSTTVFGSADGGAAGGLRTVQIAEDGTITGVFDNGGRRPLYQLAVALFNAPEELQPLGNMLWQAGDASGDPQVGAAGSGGRGLIKAESLENSNVDLAQQFIDLITLQRSFQANSRVITSSDAMLSELMNIVR